MNLPVSFNPFPDPCWPASPQEFLNRITATVNVEALESARLFVGPEPPTDPESRDGVWLRVSSVQPEINGPYTYNGSARGRGGWVQYHRVAPGNSDLRIIWVGAPELLPLFDGGDTDAPSDWSGPMWEIDTAFEFRFPVGVGVNPVTYNGKPSSTISVRQTGGAERVALRPSEGGGVEHRHVFGRQESSDAGPDRNDVVLLKGTTSATGTGVYVNGQGDGLPDKDVETMRGSWLVSSGVAGVSGSTEAHENMPPFIGVYFLRRTNRMGYYVPA